MACGVQQHPYIWIAFVLPLGQPTADAGHVFDRALHVGHDPLKVDLLGRRRRRPRWRHIVREWSEDQQHAPRSNAAVEDLATKGAQVELP